MGSASRRQVNITSRSIREKASQGLLTFTILDLLHATFFQRVNNYVVFWNMV